MSRTRHQPLLTLALMTLFVSIATGCQAKTPSLTPQEQQIVSELTQSMQTHCIGRFLVDMPKEVIVSTGQYVGHNREVTIDIDGHMSLDEFHSRMAQIEAEYKGKKTRDGEGYFFSARSPSPEIKLFERRKDDEESDASRLIEGYKWSANSVIKMVTATSDYSDQKYLDDPIVKQLTIKVDTPQKTAMLTDLLQRVRARAVSETPTEPGICFEGGFLASKAKEEVNEEFSATFEFSKMTDVRFDFSSNTYIQEKTTLLDRASQIEEFVQHQHGKTLRKGKVQLAGITQAEEWLSEGETVNSNKVNGKRLRGHDFTLEANSKIGGAKMPFFIFTLNTGISIIQADGHNTTTKSSLSDAEALALWDAVSKTIRMRPGAL